LAASVALVAVWNHSAHRFDRVQEAAYSLVKACALRQVAASNEMLWERVLSLLVVGASMLGGSAVLLMQALPPILHEFL
jgi:hypothetical protein